VSLLDCDTLVYPHHTYSTLDNTLHLVSGCIGGRLVGLGDLPGWLLF
jgi:hypothetical protein